MIAAKRRQNIAARCLKSLIGRRNCITINIRSTTPSEDSMSGLSIWIFAQQRNGAISSGAFELLAVARALADSSGGTVTAVLFGHDVGDLAAQLAARGGGR